MTPIEQMHASAAETRARLAKEARKRARADAELSDYVKQYRKEAAAIDAIVLRHAKAHRVTVGQLKGESRSRTLSEVRRGIAMEAFSDGYSESAIGRALNRDRTSISSLLKIAGMK